MSFILIKKHNWKKVGDFSLLFFFQWLQIKSHKVFADFLQLEHILVPAQ